VLAAALLIFISQNAECVIFESLGAVV